MTNTKTSPQGVTPDLEKFRAKPKEQERLLLRRVRERRYAAEHAINLHTLAQIAKGLCMFLIAMCVVGLIVYFNVMLTQTGRDITRLKSELTTLQKEGELLSRDYSDKYNLTDLEARAFSMYGLVRPESRNIMYVSLPGQTQPRVFSEPTLLDRLKEFFGL